MSKRFRTLELAEFWSGLVLMEEDSSEAGKAPELAGELDERLHKPVLLQKAVELLNCRSGGFYVDCTLGMGGHTQEILKRSAPEGTVLAFDRDEDAIRMAQQRLSGYSDRLRIVHQDYRRLAVILREMDAPPVDGILTDFGPSMMQFTTAERGFSFQLDGPLDMRMDRSQSQTAEQLVNHSTYEDLRAILRQYGEEPAAGRIARKIVEQREKSRITTTQQLRKIVESVRPRKKQDKTHPATQTFQAIRIAVNRELDDLDIFLFDAFDALKDGGRLVIIAFHSLEDRIVKQVFQFLSAACRCPRRQFTCRCGGRPLSKLLMRKPLVADEKELRDNPASRSARLRTIEKISGPAQREFWEEWKAERS